ncbi:MAG: aminopeptidase P family protein [Bacteroidales bacterium]|nr:aminopeptidase P family protein [Bacteroidales bacterium]
MGRNNIIGVTLLAKPEAMTTSRRNFIRTGGIAVATTGIAPVILNSCGNGNQEPEEAEAGTGLESIVNDVPAINQEDYDYRIERLCEQLSLNNMDAIFIEGGTNFRYFHNVTWGLSERVFGALTAKDGTTCWICPAFEKERAVEVIPQGHKIYTWEEHESPYTLMNTVLSDMGIRTGRIGMDPTLRSFVSEGFRREIKVEVADGLPATDNVRAIKTEKEIAYMDLANKVTKLAYQYGFSKLEEGMTKAQLSRHISQAHADLGAPGSGGPSFGFTSAFPHGTRQVRDLHDGDNVLVDGGCTIQGFRSDVTRTVVFGKISDRQRQVFDVVLKAQQAAHKAIRPGVTCGEVDRVARKVIEDAGFGPGYKYFAHRLGHGIGIDYHEYPYLVKDSQVVLKPGMTFSNEPGIYIYGEFGMRTEDCFVVTDDGAHILGGMVAEAIDKPFSGNWQ